MNDASKNDKLIKELSRLSTPDRDSLLLALLNVYHKIGLCEVIEEEVMAFIIK